MTPTGDEVTLIEPGVRGRDYLAHLVPLAHGWYAHYGQLHDPGPLGRMEARFDQIGTRRRTYPGIQKAARRKIRKWAAQDRKKAARLAEALSQTASSGAPEDER